MKPKHRILFCYGLLSMLLSAFLLTTASAQTALFPLEITNIKPAGTGAKSIWFSNGSGPKTENTTANITSSNRIFRAYPGLEYNIRAAVIGGVYPYTYSLRNAPLGMTINSRTGEITWPNPQANSGTITLSVTDAESTTVSTTWSITVTKNGFHFVDAAYSGTEIGSIEQPYRSLASMLAGTLNKPNSDIVYFRGGTYNLVQHNATGPNVNLSNNPHVWIAHPSTTTPVVMAGSHNTGRAATVRLVNGESAYFDGITFSSMKDYGIMIVNNANYATIRRCVFDGLAPTTDINNNYGFIHTAAGNSYYLVIQDNEFKNYRNASAIGSLYWDKKTLLENNFIHNDLPSGSPSGIGRAKAISPKYYNDYITIRGNKVVFNESESGLLGNSGNSSFIYTDNIEINFNLFIHTKGRGAHRFSPDTRIQLTTKYWRNTLIGDIGAIWHGGPYTIANNVISNPNTPWHGSQGIYNFVSNGDAKHFTLIDNLTRTDASLLVDADNDYKLTSAQSEHVGSRGWQLADGSTPLGISHVAIPALATAPAGLIVSPKAK